MCVDVHKSIAKMLGLSDERIEEILQGVDAINTDDKEKALLNFCIKASGKENYKILQEEIETLRDKVKEEIETAATEGEEFPLQDPERVLDHIYKDVDTTFNETPDERGESVVIMDAINHAIDEEME